jgi:hypothetical protein
MRKKCDPHDLSTFISSGGGGLNVCSFGTSPQVTYL